MSACSRRSSRHRRRLRPPALALAAVVACNLPHDLAAPLPVAVQGVGISPNNNMVTAAVASIDCSGSAIAWRVAYAAPGADSGQTPRIATNGCPISADLLGLLASTSYHTTVTVWGEAGDSVVAVGPNVTTGPLPNGVPVITVQTIGPPPSGLTRSLS